MSMVDLPNVKGQTGKQHRVNSVIVVGVPLLDHSGMEGAFSIFFQNRH